MKKTILQRITAALLCFIAVLQCLGGCSEPSKGNENGESEKTELPWNAFDISDYTVVYAEGADEKTVGRAEKLAAVLKEPGVTLTVVSDAAAETVEEFFDEDDASDEEPPVTDN